MSFRPDPIRIPTAGVVPIFTDLLNGTPLNDLERLNNFEGEQQRELTESKSWLQSKGRILSPLTDENAKTFDLFKTFCGSVFSEGTSTDPNETINGLKFLHTFIDRILHREGPEDLLQAINSNPILKQRLEKFVHETKQMIEVEELINRFVERTKHISQNDFDTELNSFSTQLSNRFKEQKTLWFPSFVSQNRGLEARFCYLDYSGKVTVLDARTLFNRLLADASFGETLEVSLKTKDSISSKGTSEDLYAQPFIQLHSMNLNRLHHPDFFRALLLPRLKHTRIEDKLPANYFYSSLKRYLNAKMDKPVSPKKRPEVEKKTQRNSSGIAKGLSSILYFTLCDSLLSGKQGLEGRTLYKRLKWELQLSLFADNAKKLKTCVEVFSTVTAGGSQNITKDELNRLTRSLADAGVLNQQILPTEALTADRLLSYCQPLVTILRDTLENFDRAALKESGKFAFSNKDVTGLYATSVEVRNCLEKFEKAKIKYLSFPIKDVSEPIVLGNTPNKALLSKLNFSRSTATTNPANLEDLSPLLQEVIKPIPIIQTSFESVDILISVTKQLIQITQESSFPEEVYALFIQNLLKALPIPSSKSGVFWRQFPIAAIPNVISCLDNLNRLIRIIGPFKRHCTPDETLLLYSLLTIAETLIQRLSENSSKFADKGGKTPPFRVSAYPLLIDAHSPAFQMINGESQTKLKEIINYFYPEFSAETLIFKRLEEAAENFHNNRVFVLSTGSDPALLNLHAGEGKSIEELGNATINLFRPFLYEQDPEFRKKLTDYGLEWNKSEVEQVFKLIELSSKYKDLLPGYLSHLFRLALNTYVIHSGSPSKELSLRYNCQFQNSGEVIHSLLCSDPLKKDNLNYSRLSHSDHSGPFNDYTQQNCDLNTLIYGLHSHQHPDLAVNELTRIGFSSQERREFLDLLEPNITPYASVIGASTFILNNLSRLNYPIVHKYLNSFLFRPFRIASQLKDNPQVAHKLLHSIETAIKHHAILGDVSWSTVLFLTRFGLNCHTAFKTSQTDFSPPLPDIRKTVYQSVLPLIRNKSQRKEIFETLLERYTLKTPNDLEGDCDEGDTPLIQDIMCAANAGVYSESNPEPSKRIKRFFPIINSFFSDLENSTSIGLDQQALLSGIVRAFYQNVPETDLKWKFLSHGKLETEGASGFILDWTTGELFRKTGETLEDLPRRVLSDPAFSQLAGAYTHCEKIKGKEVWILQPLGIYVDLSSLKPVFHKGLEPVEEIYYSLDELKNNFPEALFDDLNSCKDDIQCWYKKTDATPYISIAVKGKELYRLPVEEEVSGSISYRTTTFKTKSVSQTDHVSLVAEEWGRLNADFQAMFPQREGNPICWKNALNNQLESINFKTLGLSFKIKKHDGKLLAFSSDHADFHVVPNASVVLPQNSTSLSLVNHLGEEKLLLGRKISFDELFEINAVRKNRGQEPTQETFYWMEYDVREGEIIPTDVKSALHLAECYTDAPNYEAIQRLIPHLISIRRFTHEQGSFKEDHLLHNISSKLLKTNRLRPISLGLTLTAIQLENHMQFPGAIGTEDSNKYADLLNEAYLYYKQQSGNAAKYTLSKEHERTLIQTIDTHFQRRGKSNFFNTGLAQFRYFIQNRWHNLHTEKPSLKQRRISLETLDRPSEAKIPLTHWNLSNSFSPSIPHKPSFLTVSGEGAIFKNNFWAYYQIAISGTNLEKQALQRQLDLHDHIKTGELSMYKQTIQAVLKHPKKFHTFERLVALDSESHAASIALREAPHPTPLAIKKALEMRCNKARTDWFKALRAITTAIPSKSCLRTFLAAIVFYVKILFKHLRNGWRIRHYKPLIDLRMRIHDPFRPAAIPFSPGQQQQWQNIDTTFNNYFDNFVTKHFTSKEVPPDTGLAGETLPEGDANDPILDAMLKESAAELSEYRNSLSPLKQYALNAEADLSQAKKHNETQINFWKTALKSMRSHLLWQANRIPEYIDQKMVELFKRDGMGKELSWDDLKGLFLKNNLNTFRNKTLLNEDEIRQCAQGMAVYNAIQTQVDKLIRVNSLIEQFEEQSAKKGADSPSVGALVQLIPSLSLTKRAYQIAPENFHILAVEAASNYLLTEKQYQKKTELIDAQRQHDCTLALIETGAGKTTVINRVTSYEEMYLKEFEIFKRQLAVNLWPEPLETTNTKENQYLFRTAFGRPVNRLYFDRSTEISLVSVKRLYEVIKKSFEKGIPLNMRNQTMEAITLHREMLCYAITHKLPTSPDAKKILDYLIRIGALVRTFGVGKRDEEHKRNPYKLTVYSDGVPKPPPEMNIRFMKTTFKLLLEPEIHDLLQFKQNLHTRILKTDPTVFPKVQKLLVEKYAKAYKIPEPLFESFKDFALNHNSTPPEWLHSHPLRSELSACKAMLCLVLKICLETPVLEKFTFSIRHLRKESKPVEFAVPADEADRPVEGITPNLIPNLEEALTKNHLLYFVHGLHDFQVPKLIQHLKQLSDFEELAGIPIVNTWPHKFFKKMAPHYPKPLHLLNDHDIQLLIPILKHNDKAILHYNEHIVPQQMELYPVSFECNYVNELDLYNKTVSYSATPLDPSTHALNTKFIKSKGAAGQVLHLIYRDLRNPNAIRVVPKDKLPTEFSLEQLMKRPEIKATVDVGAWHKGNSNEKIAEKARRIAKICAEEDNEILAVAFFNDEDGEQCLMDIESGHIHKVGLRGSDPETRKAIYSQEKSYGSDLQHCIGGLAEVLLDLETPFSNVRQAAGRMRQWATTQRVEFLFEDPVARKIFGEDFDQALNPERANQLIVHLLKLEADKRADMSYRAQPLLMKNTTQSVCRDKMIGVPTDPAKRQDPEFRKKILNAKGNVKRALYYWSRFENQLSRENKYDPYELYANMRDKQDTLPYLNEMKKDLATVLKKQKGLTKAEKLQIASQQNSCAKTWKTLPLPPKVHASNNLGMECQVLAQAQVQLNVNLSVQSQRAFVKRSKSKWNPHTDLFTPKKWVKPSPLESKLYRLTNFLVTLMNAPFRLFLSTSKPLRNNIITVLVSTVVLGVTLKVSLIAFAVIAGFLFVTVQLSAIRFMVKNDGSHCTLMRMSEVLKDHLPKRYHGICNEIDPNFLVSNNFYNQHSKTNPKQHPFSHEMKPLREIVVIQEDNSYRFIAIDNDEDRTFITEKLKLEKESKSPPKENVRVGLYNFDLDLFSIQGRNEFDLEKLKETKLFKDAVSVSEMIKGEVLFKNYEFLERVAKKVGNKTLFNFMADNTLQLRAKNLAVFPRAPVGRKLRGLPVYANA